MSLLVLISLKVAHQSYCSTSESAVALERVHVHSHFFQTWIYQWPLHTDAPKTSIFPTRSAPKTATFRASCQRNHPCADLISQKC